MSGRAKESYSIQTVKNALRILEAIGEAKGETRITHLSAKLGMDKGKVFRLLATFESMGYVEQAGTSGKYRLGLSAYAMGQKLLSSVELLREAKPVMEQLAWELNEAVYLAVPAEREVLLVHMVNATQRIAIIPLLGQCYSLEKSAVGKVILAFRRSQGSAPSRLPEQELISIRRQGAAWDRNALGEGIATLAVPLLKKREAVCGSLCLVLPEFRFTEERLRGSLLPRMRQSGAMLSARLGHAVRGVF